MNNKETILQFDEIEICTETFGNPDDPAILLIMGASASMTWWDEEFCMRLAAKKRFVIRFDNRDVGRSTAYEPGTINYNVLDMVDDALKVLDYYSIAKAHVVGMSLGGMIAQLIAITHPERTLTITTIASGIWDDDPALPGLDEKILQYHSSAGNIDWTDRNSVIKYMVNEWKLLNGSTHAFNEARAKKLAETEFTRANNLLSMFNHAMLKGGEEYYGRVNKIKQPALIIHGDEDPVLPLPHAKAVANSIAGAKLIILEGRGHEIHFKDWDIVINEIKKHTADPESN